MISNASSATQFQQGASVSTRRTVDLFTRVWHALLTLSFAGAYITADSEVFRLVHVSLGYTLGGLLVVRLLWGFWGPRHARWSAMAGKLQGLRAWGREALAGTVSWRQAQNLYMVLSVAVVLLAITPLVLSGYVTEQEWWGEWMQEVHEFFGNFMLMAVLAHVAGVLVLSLLRRRNLAAPMVTGRVQGVGPDLIRSNQGIWAALLLCVVVAFWAWQWQQAPQAPLDGGVYDSLHHQGKAKSEKEDD